MGEKIVLTLPSSASIDFYPKNDISRYTTRLAQTVTLDENGQYEIGISELVLPTAPTSSQDCFIYCNLCSQNIVGDIVGKCLRVVRLEAKRETYEFQRIYFHELERREFDTIDLFLADAAGTKLYDTASSLPRGSLGTIIVLCISRVK